MAQARSSSTGSAEVSASKPLRQQRDSPAVEVAFAQLRDLVATSGRSSREVAAAAEMRPPALTKLLNPAHYQARRDWSQIRAILVAVGADIPQYARAHGHLWGLEPPTPAQPTPEQPAAELATGGTVSRGASDSVVDTDSRWLSDDDPTMPVLNTPTLRHALPPVRELDVPFPRVAPLVPTSSPPPMPHPMPTWVPAPATFRPRAPRGRGRRLLAVRGRAIVALTVVLVAVAAVAAVVRGDGSSEPGPGAVTAQQAPADPALPERRDPAPAAPTAPAALLSRPEKISTMAVGPTPGFAAPSPDGRTVYIAHRARGVISEIDTDTDRVRTSYPVPAGPPESLVVSPDGSRLYVSVYDRTAPTGPSALAVLDARSRAQIAAIPFATRPFISALAPSAQTLWVPDHDTGTISVVDLSTNTITREFAVSPNPHWIAFSADGARAYAANHESNVIDVIDTATFARRVSIPVGTSPHSVALQPRGPLLAVAAYDAASVELVDTTTATRIATVPVGRNPNVVRWSPDGRLLYATVESDDRIAVIEPAARRVVGEVPVGRAPSSIALTPDGTRAYVTNLDDGTVSVLRTTR